MAHVFLSSEWLDAVEVLQSELPPPERAAPNTAVALKVTDGPDGDTELTLAAGRFRREAAPNPAATLTIDYEVAKALLVDRDRDQSVIRSVVFKAIGAGKYKVDGDQSALAGTLSLSPKQVDYSPQQVEVAAKIKELTAEVPRSGFLDDLGSGSITPGEISPALRPRIDELGLEKNCRELAEQGYTVIENVADPELTTRMREYHMAHGAKGNAMLLRKDPMFCEAVLNPKLLAMVEFSVGRGANISQVSASDQGRHPGRPRPPRRSGLAAGAVPGSQLPDHFLLGPRRIHQGGWGDQGGALQPPRAPPPRARRG